MEPLQVLISANSQHYGLLPSVSMTVDGIVAVAVFLSVVAMEVSWHFEEVVAEVAYPYC